MAELRVESRFADGMEEPWVVEAPEFVQFAAPLILNADPGLLNTDGIYVTVKAKNGTWRYLIQKWDAGERTIHAKLVSSDTVSRASL